jgi:GTPase SAR1 family protein
VTRLLSSLQYIYLIWSSKKPTILPIKDDLILNGADINMENHPDVTILLLGDAGVGKSTFLS